jgi:hypothetical protein
MSRRPAIGQIIAVLELIARFHPAGLGVLLGQVREPEAAEIAELVTAFSSRSYLGVRIAGNRGIPEAERLVILGDIVLEIIKEIGGWTHVCRAAREVKDTIPALWRVAADYTAHITQGGKIRDGSGGMGKRLFGANGESKYDINERTARRRFRHLLWIIAIKIVSFPPDGKFRLEASTDGNFPE